MSTTAEATQELNKWLDRTMRGTLLGLSSRIIVSTPVDTGRLRSNWQASFNTPKDEELSRTDSMSPITEAKQATMDMSVGNDFFLTNNLSYAYPIEFDGTSKQAPSGMLRVNVTALAQALRDAAK